MYKVVPHKKRAWKHVEMYNIASATVQPILHMVKAAEQEAVAQNVLAQPKACNAPPYLQVGGITFTADHPAHMG